MKDNFENSVNFTLKWEGGYVNDPKDAGGETKYGISKRAYPNVDIKSLTLDAAKAIYKRDYWDAVSGDLLPVGVDTFVFDSAVNSGTTTAKKWLQAALGVKVDGVIGPKTLEAVKKADSKQLVINLGQQRMNFLRSLSSWKFYGAGWTNRVSDLIKFCLK